MSVPPGGGGWSFGASDATLDMRHVPAGTGWRSWLPSRVAQGFAEVDKRGGCLLGTGAGRPWGVSPTKESRCSAPSPSRQPACPHPEAATFKVVRIDTSLQISSDEICGNLKMTTSMASSTKPCVRAN